MCRIADDYSFLSAPYCLRCDVQNAVLKYVKKCIFYERETAWLCNILSGHYSRDARQMVVADVSWTSVCLVALERVF